MTSPEIQRKSGIESRTMDEQSRHTMPGQWTKRTRIQLREKNEEEMSKYHSDVIDKMAMRLPANRQSC